MKRTVPVTADLINLSIAINAYADRLACCDCPIINECDKSTKDKKERGLHIVPSFQCRCNLLHWVLGDDDNP